MLFIFFMIALASSATIDHEYGSDYHTPKESSGNHYGYDVSNEEPRHNLKLVQIVNRSGKRTPSSTYPNDPYSGDPFAPYGLGELINEGKRDMYNIGKWLRKRYNIFLGKDYYPNIVYALSSDTDRSKTSLLLELAGLFPPKDTPLLWNPKLNWQPVPFDYIPQSKDNVLLSSAVCPRYQQELSRVFLEEPKIVNYQSENQNFYEHISQLTGATYNTPIDIIPLYSILNAEEITGRELPEWTKKYYPDRLLKTAIKGYIFSLYNDLLIKLKGGPLLSIILDVWNGINLGTYTPEDRKILIYSGHENTIVNILSAFKIWQYKYPDYNTVVILELYEDKKTKNLFVKFLLKTEGNLELLIVPGCEPLCSLRKLNQMVANVIPAKDGSDCNAI